MVFVPSRIISHPFFKDSGVFVPLLRVVLWLVFFYVFGGWGGPGRDIFKPSLTAANGQFFFYISYYYFILLLTVVWVLSITWYQKI